jgi:hypothetical protein
LFDRDTCADSDRGIGRGCLNLAKRLDFQAGVVERPEDSRPKNRLRGVKTAPILRALLKKN